MSSDRIFIDMVLIIKSKRVFNELIFMLHLDEGLFVTSLTIVDSSSVFKLIAFSHILVL